MPKIKSYPCFLSTTKLQPEYPLFVFLPGMDGTGQLLRWQTADLEVAFDVRCLAIPPDDLTSWDVLTSRVVDLVYKESDIALYKIMQAENFLDSYYSALDSNPRLIAKVS